MLNYGTLENFKNNSLNLTLVHKSSVDEISVYSARIKLMGYFNYQEIHYKCEINFIVVAI